jgi:hypothetical protein
MAFPRHLVLHCLSRHGLALQSDEIVTNLAIIAMVQAKEG